MKKTLLALMVMAGSTFAQDPYSAGANAGSYAAPEQSPYSMGNGVGAPGSYPPQGAYTAPAACGPGYVWIDGYTDPNGSVVNGYCAVPPYSGAYWVAPSFYGGRFVAGYWGRGGLGYAPGFGFRGGYGPSYRVRGGYASGFHSPVRATPNLHSQGSYRGGGSAMRGGSGHGGRR